MNNIKNLNKSQEHDCHNDKEDGCVCVPTFEEAKRITGLNGEEEYLALKELEGHGSQ